MPPHSIPKATSGATRHIERSSSEIDGATANRSDDEGSGPAPLSSMKYANKFSNAEWRMLAKSKTDLRSAHPSTPKHTCTTPRIINEQTNQSGVTGGGKSVTVTATHCRKFSRVACAHVHKCAGFCPYAFNILVYEMRGEATWHIFEGRFASNANIDTHDRALTVVTKNLSAK